MVINAAPTMDAEDFIAPDVYEPMEHDAVECDRQRVSRGQYRSGVTSKAEEMPFALKCLKRYEDQLGFERTSRFAMKVSRDVPNCTIKTFLKA